MLGKNIYIYGLGSYSNRLTEELNKNGVEIIGYIDSYVEQGEHNGRKIFKISEIKENSIIVVGSSYYSEISNTLSKFGLIEYKDYCSGDYFITDMYARTSYSQYCEDLLIEDVLYKINFRNKGYYIDVGAYHPSRFSNTFKFYLKGWTGINIEPTPNKTFLFDLLRPNDINLNVGISSTESLKDFYVYTEGGYNTTNYELVQKRIQKHQIYYAEKKEIYFCTLQQIVDKYVGENDIHILNIDVEGHEIDVLNSYKWKKKPFIIAIEISNSDNDIISDFLESLGYQLISSSLITGIYVLEELVNN